MTIQLGDFVSGGYVLTRSIDGASLNQWMRDTSQTAEDLLPPQMLSVGFCLGHYAPLFHWVNPVKEDYAQIGVPKDRIPALNAWAAERFDKEVGHPNIFFRLSAAHDYIQRFVEDTTDLHLLGMGLHRERVPQLARIEAMNPARIFENGAHSAGFAGTGFARAIKLGMSVVPGEVLGFDVICLEANIDHSWHCNGLAVDGLTKFNFRPNQFGLITKKAGADKMADYADEIQSESGVWMPVLVIRYPLENRT